MAKNRKGLVGNTYIGMIKGVITSLVICIMAILIYAVVLKSFSMNDSTIPYFNQVIKILGILITSYYSVKGSNRLYMGALGGTAFVIATYLLFSLINGTAGTIAILGSDLVMGAVIGGIFGVMSLKFSDTRNRKQ